MKDIINDITRKLSTKAEIELRNYSFWGISYDFYWTMRELLYFIDNEINRTK